MPFPLLIPVIGLVGYALYKGLTGEDRAAPAAARREVEDRIALIGATSAGKSHIGNVLVGKDVFRVSPEHGTTAYSDTATDPDGREIADTPGLLDGDDSREEARETALASRVVVYVTQGELLRPEKAFLTEMAAEMGPGEHRLILYFSKHDIRLKTMPEEMRAKVLRRLKSQVAAFRKDGAFYGVKLIGPVVGGVGHYDAIRKAVVKAFEG